jgi:HD-like signal output (HDOD) protein
MHLRDRTSKVGQRKEYEVQDEVAGMEARANDLTRTLLEEVRGDKFRIPPLPKTVVEMTRLANSPGSDARAAVRMVEREPQFAAKVLQVASSSAFGMGQLNDLKQAVVRIGLMGLRDIAYALTMGSVFRCKSLEPLMKEELRHGYVTACASALVARAFGLDTQHGFLCGLLHDVGRMALLSALAIRGDKDKSWLHPYFVRHVLTQLHEEVGYLVLSRWGLHNIKNIARFHHKPTEAPPEDATLCLAVAIADLANDIAAKDAEERFEELRQQPLIVSSPLSESQLKALVKVIEDAKNDPALSAMTG